MDIRKFDVKEVVSPVQLGLGRELGEGALLVCLKGGRAPLMVTLYEGRYVQFQISVSRLSGKIRAASIRQVPKPMASLCGLPSKVEGGMSLKHGDIAALSKRVALSSGSLREGCRVRVLQVRSPHVVVHALDANKRLLELRLPLSVLCPVERLPIEDRLGHYGPKIALQAVPGQSRLAFKGKVETPLGRVEISCDGHQPVCISGDTNAHKAMEVELDNLMVEWGLPARLLGNSTERYFEHACTTYGLLSFKEHLEHILAGAGVGGAEKDRTSRKHS